MSTENFTQVVTDIKEHGAEPALNSIRKRIQEMYDLEFYAAAIMCVTEIVKLLSSLKTPHSFSIFTDNNDNSESIYLTCSLEDLDSYLEPTDIKSTIDSYLFDNFSKFQIEKYFAGNLNIELLSNDLGAKEILLKAFLDKEMYSVLKKFNLEQDLPEKSGSGTKLKI